MIANRTIILCYRKIIDAAAVKTWDKYVYESSYSEYRMQAQFYDQGKKYSSFSELVQQVPAAEKLHFLVSAAVTGYVDQLRGKMPDITDNMGRACLSFAHHRFEIVNSDIKNKEMHKVAINFFSQSMVWHDSVGQYLLLSPSDAPPAEDGIRTTLVPLQPFLGIYSVKEN
ncbi:MAG: hypothetical protein JNM19_16615 [Chitinophagaceae bacterium]|nr:hypothetical protein [Chitinophagaceae bacterium]